MVFTLMLTNRVCEEWEAQQESIKKKKGCWTAVKKASKSHVSINKAENYPFLDSQMVNGLVLI